MIKKIFTLALALTLVAAAGSPAMAARISISGNGSDSDNRVRFSLRNYFSRYQTNMIENVNQVEVSSNTGSNQADDNTGGDVSVDTGDVDTVVTVSNSGGSNMADDSDDCDCVDQEDTEVKVEGNGTDSDNRVDLRRRHKFERMQQNLFANFNGLGVLSNTGENNTDDNTGNENDGDVDVETGDVMTDILVENVGAGNEL